MFISVVLMMKGGENMRKKSLCADDSLQQKIELYSPMVYRLAYSLVKSNADADDIHQEVFVKYIKYAPCFESTEHEKAWFIRVTTNLCKNLWKSAWKRRILFLSEYEEEDRAGELSQSFQEEPSEIIDVVKTLPQKYRVVIHLFYYEQLTVEEIAKILMIKPSTVRTHLTRARQRLSKLLKEDI